MPDAIAQPVSREQVLKLAEGRLDLDERREIVRRLVSQAARKQVTVELDPYAGGPVPETAYDLAMERAFERACRLYEQLHGEGRGEEFELPAPVLAGYSPSAPASP
ncbi:MAG: hypothetical protein WAM82_19865 [Thermoanaerobaculia bacterium]